MTDTNTTALVERLRELAGQTDAYAKNQHHSFVTTQQMGRESAAALKEAADALEALQRVVGAVLARAEKAEQRIAELEARL